MNEITFYVKHLGKGLNFGLDTRSYKQHVSWRSVTYKGKRYQLFGGIRDYEFIDLANPIKSRREEEHD